MIWDFFRRRGKVVDVCVEGNCGRIEKKRKWLIVMIIAAICFLAFGDFGQEKAEEPYHDNKEVTGNTEKRCEEETEEKLKNIISTIKGAGKVNVMVVFDSGVEKILAANKSTQKESATEENKSSTKTSGEENVILFGSGSDEQPYVLEEKIPVPSGVFVTATGATNENIRLEIYEAVKALYGISGHRIKVSSASE